MDPILSRRTVLVVGAAGAGTVALAACSSSGKSGSGGNTTVQSAQSGSGQQAGGAALAKLADIEVGKCVSAKLADGAPAIVSRPTDTTAACFSAICTHMGCTVKPAGTELQCPCHGSVYDALTGEVKHGPAPEPLAKITVHVADGEIVAG